MGENFATLGNILDAKRSVNRKEKVRDAGGSDPPVPLPPGDVFQNIQREFGLLIHGSLSGSETRVTIPLHPYSSALIDI